jgi:GNAT superfamily N-acetyltransferase
MAVRVRLARAGEGAALGDLCRRSKRHWGYDDAFMATCHDSLAVSESSIEAGRVWVAIDGAGTPLGVGQLAVIGNVLDLDKLFVEPRCMGRGIGRLLLAEVASAGRELGYGEMTILADPQAAAFYERVGAKFVRMAPSDAIPGRELPLYIYRL